MRMRLTQNLVNSIKCENGKRLSILDTDVKKLELRVYPSGKKTYALYRFNNVLARPERITIGDATEIKLFTAKQMAIDLLQLTPAAAAHSTTTLLDVYRKMMLVNQNSYTEKWITNCDLLFLEQLKVLHKVKITEVNSVIISKILDDKLKNYKPSYVNKMRSQLIKVFNFAESDLRIKLNINFKRLKKYVETPTQKTLNNAEISTLLAFCKEKPELPIKNIFKLALFCGLRKGTILKLKYEYMRDNWLSVPAEDIKNRSTQKIFLVDSVINIFCKSQGYLFPAHTTTGHTNTIEKRKTKVFKDLGINARFHDLKHTFVTSCYRSGIDPHLISVMAGHRSRGVTQYYAHAQEQDLQKAYQKLEAYLIKGVKKLQKKTRKDLVKSRNTC